MALEDIIQEQYIPQENSFYKNYYHYIILAMMLFFVLVGGAASVLLYQLTHRPLPVFAARQLDNKSMALTPYDQPNLQADVILRFASQAATVAYTFDFANYKDQINMARSYFTEDGWNDYLLSVDKLITDIVERQLFANGVVAGPPVINNQGDLSGKGYTWRVAIPFIVTYQSSASLPLSRNFLVVLTIVKVPTSVNPRGIGIDQFVMYPQGTPNA